MSDLISRQALQKAMYERAFETDGDTMWQSGCWVRYRAIEDVIKSQQSAEPLTEEDYIELRDRFGEGVEFVVRDMISGKENR